MKDETYYFHQTPNDICKELLKHIDFKDGDIVYEPFCGEGNFYNNIPNNVTKVYTEIEEGLDFRDFSGNYDWVVSNPPFKIDINGKNKCAFYYLLDYFLNKKPKGLAFLANDYCFSSLTPVRLKKINELGYYIHKIVVCSIKKWRGRYYFIIINREKNDFYKYVEGNF